MAIAGWAYTAGWWAYATGAEYACWITPARATATRAQKAKNCRIKEKSSTYIFLINEAQVAQKCL